MVDLSTLKVGDSIVSQNNELFEITLITAAPGEYPYKLYENTCYIGSFRKDGTYNFMGTSGKDIVKIIPKTTTNPASETALRFNEGKTPYGNLPLDLLDGAARVMAYGAKKYGDSENFRKGYDDLVSPLHSLIRHTVELQRAIQTQDKDGTGGHLLDKESGEGHLHHIVTSAIILLHSMRLKGFKL